MTEEQSSPRFPLQAVESTNVAAIGYDAATERFGVQFKSGLTYHYEGVNAKIAESITSAKSIGSAVHSVLVKSGFKYTRLKADE